MKATAPLPESTVTFLPIILSAGYEVGSYASSEVNRNLPVRLLFMFLLSAPEGSTQGSPFVLTAPQGWR